MINRVVRGLFPTTCIVCGAVVNNPDMCICDKCYRALPMRKGFFMCRPTKNDGLVYSDGVLCPLYYLDQVTEMIAGIKFSGHKHVAVVFGKLLAQMVYRTGLCRENTILVPIPLHRDRHRRRGYNQAEEIARQISRFSGVPMGEDLLLRKNRTLPQHKKSHRERININPGFVASMAVRGKVVLLVDDVLTTGSTMEKAAQVLLERGAAAVYYLAAAGNLPLQ